MKILIIGAHSAIAVAVARRYSESGAALFLAARDPERLQTLANDLTVRGASAVNYHALDLTDTQQHGELVSKAAESLGDIDLALICHGMLPDQALCERDFDALHRSLQVNGLSALSLLSALGNRLEQQAHGSIAVITSVAGDRGRRSNYVYGASKAMLSTYIQGFRGRMHSHGVDVIDIRPGLVDSPMTSHLKKGLLFSSPERIAGCIVRGIERRRTTVYAPGYWRLIMAVVKVIPDALFKRLSF